MKKIFFIASLIFTSFLSAQTIDTIKCYNAEELRRIAKGLIERKECDSLLIITEKETQDLYDVIHVKDIIIYNTDSIVKIQNLKISDLENKYNGALSDKDKANKKSDYLLLALIVSLLANISFAITK